MPYTRELCSPIGGLDGEGQGGLLRNSPPSLGRYAIAHPAGAAVRATPDRASPLLGTLKCGHELLVTGVEWCSAVSAWRLSFDAAGLVKLWQVMHGVAAGFDEFRWDGKAWFSLNTTAGQLIAAIVV